MQARFEDADTIVVVRVMGHRGLLRHMVSTDVQVVKVYKGSVKLGQKIVLGDSADDREDTCRIGFANEARGARWLIFAKSAEDRNSGRWLIRNCGRSAPVEFAKNDINYLDRIDTYRARTRIYGSAYLNTVTYSSRTINGAVSRGAGLRVTVRGGGREFTTMTSPDGSFEIMDVPPGLYKATLETPQGIPYGYPYRAFYQPVSEVGPDGINRYGPSGLTVGSTDQERTTGVYVVYVEKGADAEINFAYYAANRISGRVFGPNGRPVPHAIVGISTYNAAAVNNMTVLADENGRYELSNNLPGKYVLAVNLRNSIHPDNPYGTLYYPGIKSRARSKVIQIGAGTVIENADFHIPAFRNVVTLSGRLVFADGSRVSGGFVRFSRDGRFQADYDEVKTSVTSDGRFRLRVVRGERGSLVGGVAVVSSGLGGCVNKTQPTDEKDVQKGFTRLFSNDTKLTVRRRMSGLIIKLRQLPCR